MSLFVQKILESAHWYADHRINEDEINTTNWRKFQVLFFSVTRNIYDKVLHYV